MSLPLSIQTLFNTEYDGFKAARFRSSVECHNTEYALALEGVSYKTKIIKNKKRGIEYILMLVGGA